MWETLGRTVVLGAEEGSRVEKASKLVRTGIVGALAMLASGLTVSFACNKVALSRETKLLEQPLGAMVEVDGRKMCVYVQGEGTRTLVFLSGSGTVSPILDFKGLYSLLSGDFRVVVIERFGYGFSDVVSTERSFGTVLRQDRQALAKLGVEGPHVLCPHSMSGLEAILWAQRHQAEVEAIAGLDMALPRCYDDFDFGSVQRLGRLADIGRKAGVVRLLYSGAALPQGLSRDERALYRAIASRIAVNETVVNEGLAVPAACAAIDAAGKPDVPTLLFVSDGSQVRAKDWARLQHEYVAGLSNSRVIELGCGHYVHNFEQERIAAEMRAFVGAVGR